MLEPVESEHFKYYDFHIANLLMNRCQEIAKRPEELEACRKYYTSLWERKTHQVEEKCMELVSPFKSKGNWNDVHCQSQRYPTCHIPPTQEPPGNL